MKYKKLGYTDIDVSLICLGTMMWGDQVDEAEAHDQIDFSLSRGVNFLDTAELYTIPPKSETQGNTERIIGSWLQKHPEKRKEIILATKVAAPGRDLNYIRGGNLKLTKKNIHDALEQSLQRLHTDYVDLYQIHWPERSTNCFGVKSYQHRPEEDGTSLLETLEALDELVRSGKVRHIGLSNETPWGVMKYLEWSQEKNLARVVSVQNPYNLLNRIYEIGLSEVSLREDCGLLAYSPLGFGVLSGKYLDGKMPEGSRYEVFPDYIPRFSGTPEALEAIRRYVSIAKKYDLSPVQMALAFVNSRSFVTSNIIGARNLEQLEEDLDSVDLVLSDEVLREIEEVHRVISNPCP